MKKKYRIISLLCCLLTVIMPNTVSAAQSPVGISAHYGHPVTGVIADSGNNAAIGQGMAESVLDPAAVYEQTENGAWVTVTLHMAKSLGKVSFAVQNRGDTAFYKADAQEVARSGEIVKYRFKVPGPDAVIRVGAEVKEMGREVIFYGLMDGNVNLSEGIASASADSELSQTKNDTGSTSKTAQVDIPDDTDTAVGLPPEAIGKDDATLESALDNTGNEYGLLTKESPELAALTGHAPDNSPWGVITRAFVTGLVICLCVLTFISIFGAFAIWVISRKLRLLNDWKEAALYDEEERL